MSPSERIALEPRIDCRYGGAAGHTLQETLITLVIVGMLFTTGLGFTRLLQSTQQSTQLNTLVAHLNLARIEAIRRSQPVSVCRSASGTDCEGGNTWHHGWIVFADGNNNGVLDEEETILRYGEPLAGGTTVRFGAFGPGGGSYLTYASSGVSMKNGTFTFCHPSGTLAPKAVILNLAGRPRISDKDSSDGPLSCP